MERLDQTSPLLAPLAPDVVEVDERAARATLRRQIAKLERDLSDAVISAFPRAGHHAAIGGSGGPRVLSLGELERVRDDLAERVGVVRGQLAERADREAEARVLLEQMLLEPGRYRWVRIHRADVGELGCGHYHVRPRLGLVGMLMGWWQVKVSSGCPLARGCGAEPQPAPAT